MTASRPHAPARPPGRLAGLCLPLALLATTLGAVPVAQAADAKASDADDRGFSYFMGLGQQTVRYRENVSLLPVVSRVTTTNPMLVTGALYAITDRLLFSLDSETTFAPGRGTERWTATEPVFNSVTLTDREVQRNGYSLSMNNLQMLAHYQVAPMVYGTGGLTARSLSFKRFGFVQGTDKAVDLPTDRTVEESVSEVVAQAGVALESGRVRGAEQHYSARASVGLPLWRRVENSNLPMARFGRAGGYDLSLEGRYSRAVRDHVHVGVWARMTTAYRPSERQGSAELPRSHIDSLSYGLELLWKL